MAAFSRGYMRMNRVLKNEMNKTRKKLSGIRGMTMGELLMVVAIITILAGVSFIMVQRHQRSLGQLERDGLAKEIFVAAQNHLAAAYGQGYLDLPDNDNAFGTGDSSLTDSEGKPIYYYIDNNSLSENSILGQMLPFGSLDETVRSGGSYIIYYQKNTGLVLDVFYCSVSATPNKYNHTFSVADYATILEYRGKEKKSQRRSVGGYNGYIIGWYGADEAANLNTIILKAPKIEVINAETLHVKVTDKNTENSGKYSIKLIITGVSSGAEKSFVLVKSTGSSETVDSSGRLAVSGTEYDVTLDDITKQGMHFADIASENDKLFIPGEDITIKAVAYSTEALSNVAYSSEETTNSLFSSIDDVADSAGTTDGVPETAFISNIRHLENLDKKISGLDNNDTFTTENPQGKINITAACQEDDLDWNKTKEGEEYWPSKSVVNLDGSGTTAGYYKPVNPEDSRNISYSFSYDGKGHRISNIKADSADAGLFGSSSYITSISNLELIDFDITGTNSAGALAGSLGTDTTANPQGTVITNVIARNSSDTSAANVSATGSCGGLVGSITGGTLQYSAASVIVENTGASGTAGGLIGKAVSGTSGSTVIDGCYSGGHTENGSYEEWLKTASHSYDVTGTTAGGLIGDADGAQIKNSYSTCSVSGTTAGGFVGSASGSIENCYAAGLIKTDDASASNANKTKGAFAGSFTGTVNDCLYYSIINEVKKTEDSKEVFDHYLGAVGDEENANITAIDEDIASYDSFVGEDSSRSTAKPYDKSLIKYYTGKYYLRSIENLSPATTVLPDEYEDWDDLFIDTHYGDWPAPEIFVVNSAS